jgi:hypothetical protein
MEFQTGRPTEPGYCLGDSPLGKIVLKTYHFLDRLENNSVDEIVANKVLYDPTTRQLEIEALMKML